MTSSPNPSSHSSSESHRRAERRAGPTATPTVQRGVPGVIAGELALTHIAGRRASPSWGTSLNKSGATSHVIGADLLGTHVLWRRPAMLQKVDDAPAVAAHGMGRGV